MKKLSKPWVLNESLEAISLQSSDGVFARAKFQAIEHTGCVAHEMNSAGAIWLVID